MSTNSNTKRNPFKILFFIALLAFGGVSLLYIASQDKTQSGNEVEVLNEEIDSISKENQILRDILAADDLLISKTDAKKSLALYENISASAETDLQKTISARIAFAKELIASNNDDEITKINLRSQLANQKKEMDSVSTYADSIAERILELRSTHQQELDSLVLKINKQENTLARSAAKQVISFTNENGNLIHYLGEVKNGKANGGGIGIWNTGSIYKGEWKNNDRHGTGEFKWADGQVYEGDFENDIRQGEGTYYWPGGEKYVGEFANNRMNGQGILYDPDGNKEYEGEWKNDKPKP